MRRILFLLLFFYSSFSFAAGNWLVAFTSDVDLAHFKNRCPALLPNYGIPVTVPYRYKAVAFGYACEVNAQPCDAPEVWDQPSQSCKVPCTEKSLGSITTKTHGFLTCKSGCKVQQLGDSTCVGVSSTGYCIAEYKQLAEFCASTDIQPSECTNCGSSVDGGGGNNGGGGDPGGGFNGGGGGGGSSDPQLPGSDGSSTGAGSNPNPPSTNGANSTALTQQQLNQSLRELFGESTSGTDCDHHPEFREIPNSTVAQSIIQAWKIRCPSTGLNTYGDGKYDGTGHKLNVASRLADAKKRYGDKLADLRDDFQNSLHANVSSGGSYDCPTYEIFGVHVVGGFCSVSPFLSKLGGLFPAIASILGAYMLLRRD